MLCMLFSLLTETCFAQFSVSVSKTTFIVDEPITVMWSTGTEQALSNDWVALYNTALNLQTLVTGAVAVVSTRANATTKEKTYTASTPGSYEFRYMRLSHVDTTTNQSVWETLATSSTFTISERDESQYLILTPVDAPIVREPFTVRWWKPASASFQYNDWISLYDATANLPTLVTGKLAVASARAYRFFGSYGQSDFTVIESGSYEVRYMRYTHRDTTTGQYVYETLATGGSFTVREPISDPTLITNFPSNGQTIVMLGDSITAGIGASEDEDLVSEIERRLCCTPVINAGVSGDTTANALSRLDTDVLAFDPKIVIVELGGNDFIQRIPSQTTFNNLKEIIDRCHNAGAVVILVGIQGGRFLNNFADEYRELAQQTGCAYIPNVMLGIVGNIKLLSDLVHPNDWGYSIMAKRIAPTVAVLSMPAQAQVVSAEKTLDSEVALTWVIREGLENMLVQSDTVGGVEHTVAKVRGRGVMTCVIIPEKSQAFYTVNLTKSKPDAAMPRPGASGEELEAMLANEHPPEESPTTIE